MHGSRREQDPQLTPIDRHRPAVPGRLRCRVGLQVQGVQSEAPVGVAQRADPQRPLGMQRVQSPARGEQLPTAPQLPAPAAKGHTSRGQQFQDVVQLDRVGHGGCAGHAPNAAGEF
jgi:hypothetical protein